MTAASDPRQLDFLLIGAQKCATSWMYYCLRDHPEICVPDKKLEAGYIGGAMYRDRGADWFFDRFHCAGATVRGDVSVEYLYDFASPAAVAPFVNRPRLIVSLRNPVDRMISGYFWLVRRGKLGNLPLKLGLAPILAQRPGFPDPIDGPLEEVVRRSFYGPQIDNFIDSFGADAMLAVLYEDLAADGLGTIRRVYDFLGVDAGFPPPSLTSAPKRNAYNPWLLALENRFPNKVVAKLVNAANQALVSLRPRPDILPADLRARLDALFAPAIAQTQQSLSRLPAAQRPTPEHLQQSWKGGRV